MAVLETEKAIAGVDLRQGAGASPSPGDLQASLDILHASKDAWANLSPGERITLLDEIHASLPEIEERWVAASMAAKAARPRTVEEGEEQFTLTVIYRFLRYMRQALSDIDRYGRPRFPGKITHRYDGRVVVGVLPGHWSDRVALPRIRAEVWFKAEGLDKRSKPRQASYYQVEKLPGKVALVLAAGNVASLPAGDMLHKLFVERQVVLLKTNPVNAYLKPLLAEGFRPLIRRGYLQIIQGGADLGFSLAHDPRIDEVHLTGSDRTYEAVIFGEGDKGRARKRKRQPLLDKRFTAELGSVSPVIIVPGPWSRSDLSRQAANLASWLAPNAGFNCTTPRVLINWAGWSQRKPLVDGIVEFLERIPTRKAYYPGAIQAHEHFTRARPVNLVGDPQEGHLPWTLVPDLNADDVDEVCFNKEAFLGLFAETALDAGDIVSFIKKAVTFANERLWGTLSASIIVHPNSLKDQGIAAAVDQAIADLRYGSVIINHWGALAYYAMVLPWGGYPGSDMYNIQSGNGVVNNPLMFDGREKSVIYTPFRMVPDPFAATAKRSYHYFRRDTRYQHQPSFANLARLMWAAVRS